MLIIDNNKHHQIMINTNLAKLSITPMHLICRTYILQEKLKGKKR
jgi:hypothetical protein